MPNHITTRITISDEKDFLKVLDFVASEESEFDFNKIIPMPKELVDTTSPSEKPNTELIKKYGYDNWYDWAINNWDTKWNCYELSIENNTIEFQTAWSTPLKVLQALSKKFPSTLFSIEYADEDLGYNCGSFELLNGKVRNETHPEFGSDEAIEFACGIKGYDYEEYLQDVNA